MINVMTKINSWIWNKIVKMTRRKIRTTMKLNRTKVVAHGKTSPKPHCQLFRKRSLAVNLPKRKLFHLKNQRKMAKLIRPWTS